jgi:hypothetical protein
MSITNKSKEELIKEALENQYQLKAKEATIAKQKEKEQKEKIDKLRRVYLGHLYGECRSNPKGVRRDKLEEQYNKLKKEGCISNCSFNEFIKTCELSTYYPDCSNNINCMEKSWDKTTEKGKQLYNEYSSIYNPTSDLKDEVKYLRNIIEEQNKDIIGLKKKFDTHIKETSRINELNYELWDRLSYTDNNNIIFYGCEDPSKKKECNKIIKDFMKDKKKLYSLIKDIKNPEEEVIDIKIDNIFKRGLIGLYTADSLTEKTWIDISGEGNNAINEGSYVIEIPSKNPNKSPIKIVKGGSNEGIIFPSSILPEIYTLITISRYGGNKRGRIFAGKDSLGKDYAYGFWNGKNAFIHKAEFVSKIGGNKEAHNEWYMNIDTGDRVWSNGNELTEFYYPGHSNLTVNRMNSWNGNEASDFEIAYVAIFNRHLSDDEIVVFSDYLKELYDIIIT